MELADRRHPRRTTLLTTYKVAAHVSPHLCTVQGARLHAYQGGLQRPLPPPAGRPRHVPFRLPLHRHAHSGRWEVPRRPENLGPGESGPLMSVNSAERGCLHVFPVDCPHPPPWLSRPPPTSLHGSLLGRPPLSRTLQLPPQTLLQHRQASQQVLGLLQALKYRQSLGQCRPMCPSPSTMQSQRVELGPRPSPQHHHLLQPPLQQRPCVSRGKGPIVVRRPSWKPRGPRGLGARSPLKQRY